MPEDFAAALNKQIANEFAAHQQYVAAAVYYDAETLPQLAAFFYRQAIEERNHAMMMVQYLLDTDQQVRVPAVDAPETSFADIVAPVAMALEQEKTVGEEINALFKLARDSGNYPAEQFLLWFVKELHLMMFPVILGYGNRMFGDTTDKTTWKLTASNTVGEGIPVLTFQRADRA